jgi:hypothetical protein
MKAKFLRDLLSHLRVSLVLYALWATLPSMEIV